MACQECPHWAVVLLRHAYHFTTRVSLLSCIGRQCETHRFHFYFSSTGFVSIGFRSSLMKSCSSNILSAQFLASASITVRGTRLGYGNQASKGMRELCSITLGILPTRFIHQPRLVFLHRRLIFDSCCGFSRVLAWL